MKFIKFLLVGISMLILLSSFDIIKQYINKITLDNKEIEKIDILSISSLDTLNIPLNLLPPPSPRYDLGIYLEEIGKMESGNKYNIVNKYGYMGRYQFGMRTLRGLGYKGNEKQFLSDTLMQEKMMMKLMVINKRRLKKYIEKYDQKIINGVKVTESGLIAAAHLGGSAGVKRWIKNGSNPKDAFGTSIETYVVKFGGYTLNLPEKID